jgi:hypothetical protein
MPDWFHQSLCYLLFSDLLSVKASTKPTIAVPIKQTEHAAVIGCLGDRSNFFYARDQNRCSSIEQCVPANHVAHIDNPLL